MLWLVRRPWVRCRLFCQAGKSRPARDSLHAKLLEHGAPTRTVRRARDRFVSCSERCRPACAKIMEVRFVLVNSTNHLRLECIAADHDDVDGKPDTEVRAHRRIHRNEADLQRIVEVGSGTDRAVEDWLGRTSQSSRYDPPPCCTIASTFFVLERGHTSVRIERAHS